LLAELALRKSDIKYAHTALADVRAWTDVTHDVEVALGAHSVAASLALREGDLSAAQAETEAGLSLSQTCGFGLATIDLLLRQCAVLLALPEPTYALELARRAYALASDPACSYCWGEAAALHLLGSAHKQLGEHGAARGPLERSAAIRLRISDPELTTTTGMLAQL
jgi:hypothetical protein